MDSENLIQSLLELFDGTSDDCVDEIEKVRAAWRKKVMASLGDDSNDLEQKLLEGDEAFGLLHRALKQLKLPEEEAEKRSFLSRAKAAFEARLYEQSFKLYQQGVVSESPGIEELCVAGTAAVHCGKFEYAEEYANQALLKNNFDIKAIVLKGLALLKQDKTEEALRYFERANRLEPQSKTVIRYVQMAQEKMKEAKDEDTSAKSFSALTPSTKRKWFRKPVSMLITLNDFESMAAMSYQVKSLSAGGALVEGAQIPEEFNFTLELGKDRRVHGKGKKIYHVNDQQAGVVFEDIHPDALDLINQAVISA